jgi:hypothetical protein
MNRKRAMQMYSEGLELIKLYEKRLKKRYRILENAETRLANGEPVEMNGGPTACELATEQVLIAMIAQELACGSGPSTGA